MSIFHTVMPIVAAGSLAMALFMPLRDDRRGKRATVLGTPPFVATFLAGASSASEQRVVPTAVAVRFADEVSPPAKEIEERTIDVDPCPSATVPADDFASIVAAHAIDDAIPSTERGAPHGAVRHLRRFLDGGYSALVASAVRLVTVEATTQDVLASEGSALDRLSTEGVAGPIAPIREPLDRDDEGAAHVPLFAENAVDITRATRTWAVPLTRLALRASGATADWTRELSENDTTALPTRTARHALLARLAKQPDHNAEGALRAAYAQEDRAGRLLALAALRHVSTERTTAVFCDALSRGCDEERALALDALVERGERDAVAEGLWDRVDAIAAAAALAFVGTHERRDYERVLGPLLETSRIDALLRLLAGIVT